MTGAIVRSALVVSALVAWSAPAWAQALAGPEKARPVQGDPGISSMQVLNTPFYRVLRDYAEPGATRRLHNHADATYHVFVLVTGRLLLTVEGQPPVEVGAGEALALDGGAMHTFRNIGTVTSTIVEVFGKGPAGPGDVAFAQALAAALAPPPSRR
ncbi:MAG: cupin domain-containing protein [Vicinamibacterales bacterium]